MALPLRWAAVDTIKILNLNLNLKYDSIYKNTDTNMVYLNYCNKLIFPNQLTSVAITSLQNHLIFLVCGLSHNSKSSPLIGVSLVRHPSVNNWPKFKSLSAVDLIDKEVSKICC